MPLCQNARERTLAIRQTPVEVSHLKVLLVAQQQHQAESPDSHQRNKEMVLDVPVARMMNGAGL